jgi:SAM-dependent methyltransferase
MTRSSVLAEPVDRLVSACERLDAGDPSGRGALRAALAGVANAWATREPEARCALRDACVRGVERWSAQATLVQRARRGEGTRRSFSVIEHVLENEPYGEGLAAKEFDRVLLSSHALSALRARRVVFGRELVRRFRARENGAVFRVAALNAGPAPELLEFLAGLGPEGRSVHAVVVDGDEASLNHVEQRFAEQRCEATLELRRIEPARAALLREPLSTRAFDFVYSPASFDYVPDDLAARCLEHAFAQLKPGGSLFLAHYHRDLTSFDRMLLEWWLGWFPYFRAPKELARVVTQTSLAKDGTGAGAVRGPNVYVFIERKD